MIDRNTPLATTNQTYGPSTPESHLPLQMFNRWEARVHRIRHWKYTVFPLYPRDLKLPCEVMMKVSAGKKEAIAKLDLFSYLCSPDSKALVIYLSHRDTLKLKADF